MSQSSVSGGGSGSGTVTSVAITGSDGIDVDSGSPITSSGTIALGLSNIGDAAISSAATWNAKQDAVTAGTGLSFTGSTLNAEVTQSELDAKPDVAGSSGQIQFNSSGNLGADSNLTWDDANDRLGIGISSPSEKLSVSSGNIVIDNGQAYRSKNTSGVTRTLLTLYTDNKLYVQSPSETVFQTNTDSSTVNAMTIDSSGDVGIGTTSPSEKLHVNGHAIINNTLSGSGAYLKFNTLSTGGYINWQINGSEKMRLASDGALTSTSTSADAVFLKSSHANNTNVYIANTNATTSNTANLYFAPANNVSGAKISAIATEDFSTSANRSADLALSTRSNGTWVESMRLYSGGSISACYNGGAFGLGTTEASRLLDCVGVASFQDLTAEKQLLIANNSSDVRLYARNRSDDSDVSMVFHTGVTERMRIDSSGNLGIGISSPDKLLTLSSSSPEIRFYDSDLSNVHSTISGSGGHLTLQADGGNGAGGSRIAMEVDGTEQMRLDSSGNLGIGTTAPSCELHVKTATTSGITNTSKVGIQTEDSRGGGAIFGGTDMNHAILFRYGRDNTVNVLDYHAYGSHRFYTNSSIQSQVERMRIDSNGRVTIKKSSNAEAQTVTIASNTATCDLDEGNNFEVSIPASGSTNIVPSNLTVGQSGVIRLAQGGGATTFSTIFKWQSGTTPTPSTSGVDLIAYYVDSSTTVSATYLTNVS